MAKPEPPTRWPALPAPRDQAFWFAQLMEQELRANEHKAGWEGLSIPYLLERIHANLAQLERAIQHGQPSQTIAGQAADAGNFLMMLCDNYRTQEFTKHKGGQA